jgi:dihydrofolate reductase
MFGGKARNYIFTHRPPPEAIAGVEFVSQSAGEFCAHLRRQRGKDIWIMGGGGLIASLLDVGAIDEFIISVIPIFIGEGIPLIAPARRTVQLQLAKSKPFPDGVVQLHYRVIRSGA